MASMDENPFGRRGRSPTPKTSFQRELEEKMQDRRRRGLAADVTPQDSAHGSDEELASDDGKYTLTGIFLQLSFVVMKCDAKNLVFCSLKLIILYKVGLAVPDTKIWV